MSHESNSRKPNFVIILADDMGYGDSSAYGGWIDTPHMEALAAAGLKFTDFHSSGSVCSPTRAGLMTGRYQQRAGIPGVINADPAKPSHAWGLSPGEVTFPKLLRQAGYVSAIFGKWHLGYTPNFNPIHHGFDRFRGYVAGCIDYFSHRDRMGAYDWWEGTEHIVEEGYSTHLIGKHAVQFIEDNKDRPFCLYIAHEAVHGPYQGPGDAPSITEAGRIPDQRTRAQRRGTYTEMMTAMDDSIGQVVDTLARLGLSEETLVFFFSDNGPTSLGSAGPCRGFKADVWEGGHRVPAIAAWPGTIAPGTVSDALTISLDLMPTMLELAGAAIPDGHALDGISLADHMRTGASLGARKLHWRGDAMRDGTWKLVIEEDGPALYDLAGDIGETTNVAGEHGDRVARMLAEIEAWKTDVTTGATGSDRGFRETT